MAPLKQCAKKQAKARQRRRLHAHERLERDRRQAQRAAADLHQALEDLALPETVVAEKETVKIRGGNAISHAGLEL